MTQMWWLMTDDVTYMWTDAGRAALRRWADLQHCVQLPYQNRRVYIYTSVSEPVAQRLPASVSDGITAALTAKVPRNVL